MVISNVSPRVRLVACLMGFPVAVIVVLLQTGVLSRYRGESVTAPKQPFLPTASIRVPTKAIVVTPPVPTRNDSSLSPVPLPLFLVSVKPGRSIREGAAQIGVVRESPQTYQAGALLENGARLTEIHADYVLLERDGHTARLYLADARPGATADKLAMVGGNERAAPAAITSREPLTAYIRGGPLFEGTRVVGLRVYAGSRPEPFFRMGLQQGDVITAIDGVAVEDLTSSWERLRGIVDGAVLTASVKRNSEVLQVRLDGGLVASAEAAGSQVSVQARLGASTQ